MTITSIIGDDSRPKANYWCFNNSWRWIYHYGHAAQVTIINWTDSASFCHL